MSEIARCRSCKQPVLWVETEASAKKPARMMPIDADAEGHALKVDDGNLVFTGNKSIKQNPIVRYLPAGKGNRRSHFASCPSAADFRKRNK